MPERGARPRSCTAALVLDGIWCAYMTGWLGTMAYGIFTDGAMVPWLAAMGVPAVLSGYALFSGYFLAYIFWVCAGTAVAKACSAMLLRAAGYRTVRDDWQADRSPAWTGCLIQFMAGAAAAWATAIWLIVSMGTVFLQDNPLVLVFGALAGWTVGAAAVVAAIGMSGISGAMAGFLWLALGWARSMLYGNVEKIPYLDPGSMRNRDPWDKGPDGREPWER